MLLGLAITQHCNLRCPHCIRDDVTTVQSLSLELVRSIVTQAEALFERVDVSLTGGEPLLHPHFAEMVAFFAERGLSYRFVSNGWHMKRVMPVLDRYPPHHVRLSLSGVSEAAHDAVRGRGSFRRVLLAAALLTSRRIPASLSLVVDRACRARLREAADLAEALGVLGIGFILPQPSAGSLELDTEVDPREWAAIREEVEAIAAEPGRRTAVGLDYGAPFAGPEHPCDTFVLRRIYVDAWGRLSTCCQLSDYGYNRADVVADLAVTPFAEAFRSYLRRIDELARGARPGGPGPLDSFPCMRCVRASGKLAWLERYPDSAWARLAFGGRRGRVLPVLPAGG
jgi:MoaA/NifB/PqqE/SkfB family radical SAM enzyme